MIGKVYAQLYSLLRTNQEDLIPALEKISEIGFDGVELMGTYMAGMSVQEYKQYLKNLKLDPISSHGLHDEADFAQMAELGIRYTDIRPMFRHNNYDEVMRACEQMNEAGKLRAKYGLKGVLHNHANELAWLEGKEGELRVYDLLLQNTDPTYVGFEFDVGWASFAGADVVEIVKKYPGRFPLIHVKEANRVAHSEEEFAHFPAAVLALGMPQHPKHPEAGTTGYARGFSFFSEAQAKLLYESRDWNARLGQGIIDWPALVEACNAQGTEAFVCEREYYSYPGGNGDAGTCAKHDFEYLRSL